MEIIYQNDRNRYELSCSFEERNEAKKSGFKWCPENNVWFAPDWYAAWNFYKISSPTKKIPELDRYSRNYKKSYAIKSDNFNAPHLAPFQNAGVEELALRDGFVLLADEQGLGKTAQALELFKIARTKNLRKALVISPASLKINWQREVEKFDADNISGVQILKEGTNQITDPLTNFVVVNYDLLDSPIILSELEKYNADIVFGDEIHFAKNPKAARTQLAFKIALKAKRFIPISGTPIPNRPIEIFPLLKKFCPEALGRYADQRRFEYKFCAGFEDRWGFNNSGASNLEELGERLRATCMIRRLKGKDTVESKKLPPKIIAFEADKYTKDLVVKEKEIAAEFLKKNKEVPNIGEIAEIRQELALKKLPLAIQFIEDLLLGHPKVIVFAHHRAVLSELSKHFQERLAVSVAGGMTSKAKQKAVDAFQNNKNCEVFIGQIKAAGVGLTLTAGTQEVFVETSWSPGDIDQCMDRADRIGQEFEVQAWFLTTENSLEEHMLKVAFDKAKNINKIMG